MRSSTSVISTPGNRRTLHSSLQASHIELDLHNTSVDAKHHEASLSERQNVTWVGINGICTHYITALQIKTLTCIRLWVKESQEIFLNK